MAGAGRARALALATAAAVAVAVTPAHADFPYPAGIDRAESPAYRLGPGQAPPNFNDNSDWELTGTPDPGLASQLTVNRQPDQLCGIRGISFADTATTEPSPGCAAGQPVRTAVETTTGNPDVQIAVLDSGIEWNDANAMASEADKVWLNTGELPAPRHDLSAPLAPLPGGRTCASFRTPHGGDYERLGNYWPDGQGGVTLNRDGSSCYGTANGADVTLDTTLGLGNGSKLDTPDFAAVGEPAFGTLDGRSLSLFDQGSGLLRALDVAVNGYQKGGQDFILGWNASSGQFDLGFPAPVNDLGFLTGETVGDITGGAPAQEVLGGTASLDVAAFGAGGAAVPGWPKLSGDWLIATPTLGSLGSLDFTSSARRDVVTITRSGTLSVYGTPAAACAPSSWPSWHHDLANSGDYTRDATPPGTPADLSVAGGALHFLAPGGDGECGTAERYEVVTSSRPITASTFAGLQHLGDAPAPAAAGTAQSFALPARPHRYVAIRAVDGQGNIGPAAEFDTTIAGRAGAPSSPPASASCIALAPSTTLGPPIIRRGRRVSFAGRSLNASCGTAAVGTVRVAISVPAAHGRCRFVASANGELTRPQTCARPVYVSASVARTTVGHSARFTLMLKRPLPRGRYTTVAIAADAGGRAELPADRDVQVFRVR